MTSLSIVIPAYNEGRRLPPTLLSITEAWQKNLFFPFSLCEVIIVDDGSQDDTVSLASNFKLQLPINIKLLNKNQGEGAAVRAGMLHATGDIIAFYDADGATPPEEIGRLGAALLSTPADIAIGSRALQPATVQMPWHRRLIGRIYHRLCGQLIPGIQDAACGCKLFRRESAHRLFKLQTINRFAFDIEILALALAQGERIIEIPVRWTAIPDSRLHLLRDGFNMLVCVLRMRRDWTRFKKQTKNN